MAQWRFIAVAAFALLIVPDHPARADVDADYKAANKAYDSGKYPEADRLTTLILKESLNQQGRVTVLILRGISRNALGKYKGAVDDFNKAFALADKQNKGVIRYDRLTSYLGLEQYDDAYKDLLVLAQSYPNDIKDVTLRNIFAVGRRLLKTERHDDLLTLLLALKKANYRGPDPLITTDYLYKYLIQELVDHKRADEAIPLVADLAQYDALMELSTQARYAALRTAPGMAPLLQPQDFPARQLAYAQKLAAQNPKSLKTLTHLVAALRLNARYAEAAKAGQDALKSLAKYDKDAEYELWLRNEVAYALQAQGLFADANALLQPLLKQDAKDNSSLVNQFINLGIMLVEQGRYQDAMAAAAKAHGHSSSYGEKSIQYVNACALSRMGKTAEAEIIFLDMLKKPEEGYDLVTDAALCLKHEDQAAAIVLARLKDKTQQDGMLANLQTCRDNPKRPPLAREMRATLMRLRARPDVKAAIAPVGVVTAQPIACGDN